MRSSGDAEAGTSPLVIFGAELRHWRQAAGLSQEQLGPYAVGAHPGMLGNFVIAGFGDAPSIVYLDTAAAGQIVETPGVVDQVTLVWEALRSEALPRAASRDLIAKIAEEK